MVRRIRVAAGTAEWQFLSDLDGQKRGVSPKYTSPHARNIRFLHGASSDGLGKSERTANSQPPPFSMFSRRTAFTSRCALHDGLMDYSGISCTSVWGEMLEQIRNVYRNVTECTDSPQRPG